NNIATEDELNDLDKAIKKQVRDGKKAAWNAYLDPIINAQKEALAYMTAAAEHSSNKVFITKLINELSDNKEPIRKDVISAARRTLRYLVGEDSAEKSALQQWINTTIDSIQPKYSSHLHSASKYSVLNVTEVAPTYDDSSDMVDARVILRDNFDAIFGKYPESLVFGEDAGNIGDVNQGLEGLQEKYGELRVADAGIREATIVGQGIGMAMRGLRPIAEIQYLDYILYALQIMSDDLATLQYRTKGLQKAPLIVRTRGHRLEGIWHSGSQLGGIINLVRGIHVLVPRNMTKAAGFYNTLLESDEPAIIIECLNGYRLKEKMPTNIGEFKTPLGVVETVKDGNDITIVSYGSTLRIVEQVAKELLEVGIDAEVIDVQTLLPFDLKHDIVKSVAKTNRLLVVDEDVPGGASAYILNEILNTQKGFQYLDSEPRTLAAQQHRPAYGTDGDYFSKPSAEDIFETVYDIMHEVNPSDFPRLR
ncbi:MAG: transketolase, partial [Psychroserpens sp.]|nr:transketolase [Psychroserpens sp.]